MMTVIEKTMYGCRNCDEPQNADQNKPNWEQRRYEIAKDMMAAIMNNPDITAGVACEPTTTEGVPGALARVALKFANALAAELQNEPFNNNINNGTMV